MDAPPLHRCNRKQIEDALADFIRRGLVVTYPNEDLWHMKLGKREGCVALHMTLTRQNTLWNLLRLSLSLALAGIAYGLTKAAEGFAWASAKVWRSGAWVTRD